MNFLKKKKKIITGLQIGNSWLTVVQLDISKGKKEVINIVKKDIKSLSVDKISKAIKDISKDIKIDSSSLTISVPYYFVTTRTLELPSVNPKEIKDMVDLQIGKQTPYNSEDVISNYQIVDIGTIEGYSRVFLAIVHKDIVQRQLDILEKAGLATDKVGLSSEGLLKWSQTIYKEVSEDKPHILIDIGYNNSDFEIILRGKLIFSKTISVGAVNFKNDKEQALDKLNKAINHFIYDYQNAVINQDIEKGVVTGASLVVDSLDRKILEEKLGFDIEVKNQFDDISIKEDIKDDAKEDVFDLSLVGIFGLIFGYKSLDINFLPHELVIEKEVKERAKDIYVAGVLLVLIPIFISGIFLERTYNKRVYLEKLKSKLTEVKNEANKLEKKIEKIKLIKKESNIKSVSLNLLFEIYNSISPEIYLISISYDGEEKVTMRGTSSVMSQVFNFVDKLEKSEYFKNVETKYANVKKTDKGEVVDFEIICTVELNQQKS
ncbi:MAG: pilus assembly protein PilM [Candidatus Omnitrophica bacterium]|nr:pilus assembly protein PilM [Candidatus Omnitrophota bacterium]MCF7878945.1 pilus assembly protein PilM [Candidatus Omnitrophota bacterium]